MNEREENHVLRDDAINAMAALRRLRGWSPKLSSKAITQIDLAISVTENIAERALMVSGGGRFFIDYPNFSIGPFSTRGAADHHFNVVLAKPATARVVER